MHSAVGKTCVRTGDLDMADDSACPAGDDDNFDLTTFIHSRQMGHSHVANTAMLVEEVVTSHFG